MSARNLVPQVRTLTARGFVAYQAYVEDAFAGVLWVAEVIHGDEFHAWSDAREAMDSLLTQGRMRDGR